VVEKTAHRQVPPTPILGFLKPISSTTAPLVTLKLLLSEVQMYKGSESSKASNIQIKGTGGREVPAHCLLLFSE
jgi:hypothetical protein